ncbi:MAG: four helix bundle protein [Candidatus Sulfotelmatobacter sp.]
MSHSYRDLLVWQKAKSLAVRIYQETESSPKSEIYGLTSQIRSGYFGRVKHRRRPRKADAWRVSTVSRPLARFPAGA